ncbi:hypothetical protein FOZ63_008482, partial [Perkinsus olseni]
LGLFWYHLPSAIRCHQYRKSARFVPVHWALSLWIGSSLAWRYQRVGVRQLDEDEDIRAL